MCKLMDEDKLLFFSREQMKRLQKSSFAVLRSRNPQCRWEQLEAKRKPQILDTEGYDII